jgi:predicted transcriptional regulator
MKIQEIVKILDAEVLCGKDKLDTDILTACGSDMMSDVLAYVKDQGILLTGLCNPQVVRTAEMMDLDCVCFVRGKMPDKSVLELAERTGLILLTTKKRMYLACGLLFSAGLNASN